MLQLFQQLQVRNCQQIDLLNEQILALLGQAHLRAQRRSKILAIFKLSSAGESMHALFAQMNSSRRKPLQQSWQQLKKLAAECKRLNERNGKLLAMHNDILDQLLSADSGAELYRPQFY